MEKLIKWIIIFSFSVAGELIAFTKCCSMLREASDMAVLVGIAEASGQAKANQIVAQSITPELIQFHAVQKWNGILPMVSGQAGQPFINFSANEIKDYSESQEQQSQEQ